MHFIIFELRMIDIILDFLIFIRIKIKKRVTSTKKFGNKLIINAFIIYDLKKNHSN